MPRLSTFRAAGVLAALAAGTGMAAALPAQAADAPAATAAMQNTNGDSVGEVSLRDTPNGLLLSAKLTNLPAGTHAFHIHQTGKCEPPFDSAGGHLNPGKKAHGIATKEGPHAGDMVNIHVSETGQLEVERWLPLAKLDDVMDDDGSAVVIHQGSDDYATDPAGDAGPRIACGVFKG